MFIASADLRRRFIEQAARCGMAMNNTFGTVACEAAYRHGKAWVDEMRIYIGENRKHFASQVEALGLPFAVTRADALYLAWLDFRALNISSDELHRMLMREGGLWLNVGTKYHAGGAGFMRIDLACPRQRVDEALSRFTHIADFAHVI